MRLGETPTPFDLGKIDNLEMSMTVLTSPGCNMSVHMGIERNIFHIANKNTLPTHEKLALKLHRFAAKTTQNVNPIVQYFTTKPTFMMKRILKKQLPNDSYVLGEEDFKRLLKEEPQKFKNLSHNELINQPLPRITVDIGRL
ncbi:hypothetical protein [Candidatus Finniella inopinata]|uniref:Uncharacterized protein n=1 Tax=Candidatus Finniella inopinata TaxID=1696036 RepID=A0A4Q7DJU7_9PROT|nr:hypothetical protein [Candidatus Finniella inopinata]RZI46549.1 hypothetical protein EQU50_02885 [Candidatus Finniella inopinata]